MKRVTKKALYTGLTAVTLLGAIPLISPGTASAQPDSRICGRHWSNGVDNLFLIYEVQKVDDGVCRAAIADQSDPATSGFSGTWTLVSESVAADGWENPQQPGAIFMLECEQLPLTSSGDVCHQMERTDGISNIHRYWVYVQGENVTVKGA